MDDHNLSGAVAVRVGVLFTGTSVGRPARVADPVSAFEGLEANDLFQVAELALGATHLKAAAVSGDGNAGGVVAAILKTTQPIDDDRHNLLFADVSDDATHKMNSLACARA